MSRGVRSKPHREGEAPAEPESEGDELPEGWTVSALGQIARDISYGYTAKATDTDVGPRLLRITDIQGNAVNWDTVPFCEIEDHRINSYRLSAGDLVFTRTGATTGKSFLIKSCPDSVFASYLIRVRPSAALLPEYVAAFFQTRDYWNQITENLSGSAQPNCNASKLASLVVPVAPLAEQRRIVGKLELLLGKVSSSQQRLSRVPGLLKRFRQSVLAAACSGKLTADWREQNPTDAEQAIAEIRRIDAERRRELELARKQAKQQGDAAPKKPYWESYDRVPVLENDETPASWATLPVGFLCDCIVPGRDKPKSFTGSVPWVTLPDINGPEISASVSGLGLSASEIEEVSARVIPINAVVMSCIGRFGLAAVVTTPLVVNQQLHAFLPSHAVVPKYLAFHIPVLADYMNSIATSTTIAYLNKDNCNSIPINTPPLSEQQEIVRRVEKLFAFADQIEARLRQAQAHVDRLTQSLLAKAFRGELVPTEHALAAQHHRPYQTASALLASLRETSHQAPKTKSKRSAKP